MREQKRRIASWRHQQLQRPAESRAIGVPYVDCWRLVIEHRGALLSAERGERVEVGTVAVCRYDPGHRPPVAGCECGFYAVSAGGFDIIQCFFGGPIMAKYKVNGVLLHWTARKADKYPVMIRVRLYQPWTDPHHPGGVTSFRGHRFDVLGPAYAISRESAARLDWLGVPVEVVDDIEATACRVLS